LLKISHSVKRPDAPPLKSIPSARLSPMRQLVKSPRLRCPSEIPVFPCSKIRQCSNRPAPSSTSSTPCRSLPESRPYRTCGSPPRRVWIAAEKFFQMSQSSIRPPAFSFT
jgi:hypothetical protein